MCVILFVFICVCALVCFKRKKEIRLGGWGGGKLREVVGRENMIKVYCMKTNCNNNVQVVMTHI